MEQQTGSKSGKEYVKAVYCHPAYLIYMQSTSWETLGWMKHNLESRLPGEKTNNLRYADGITLMAESEEELKSLLMKVKEESEKVGLKHNIRKTKIMASSPVSSLLNSYNYWIMGSNAYLSETFSQTFGKKINRASPDHFLSVPDFCIVLAFNHSNYQKAKPCKTMTSEKRSCDLGLWLWAASIRCCIQCLTGCVDF